MPPLSLDGHGHRARRRVRIARFWRFACPDFDGRNTSGGPMNFDAVILAGGKSSRMNRDKAFLNIDGRTLLARQIELVRLAGATKIFISGRSGKDYSGFNCPVLEDKFPDAGPLAGIERALEATTEPMLLVVAVDLPNLTRDLLGTLARHCRENAGAIPRINGKI